MTEYSNESFYQEEKPKSKVKSHFKENGFKTGKVHLPWMMFGTSCSISISCGLVIKVWLSGLLLTGWIFRLKEFSKLIKDFYLVFLFKWQQMNFFTWNWKKSEIEVMLTTFGCYWLGLDFQNYWNSYHIGRRYHYCWSASGLVRERYWISSSARTNIFICIK